MQCMRLSIKGVGHWAHERRTSKSNPRERAALFEVSELTRNSRYISSIVIAPY